MRSRGVWGQSIGRTIAAFMLQGVVPYSFRERVRTQLRWCVKDETNLDEVRRMISEVEHHLEVDLAARAFDDELDGTRYGRKEAKQEKKQEMRDPKFDIGDRRDKRAGGGEQPRIFKGDHTTCRQTGLVCGLSQEGQAKWRWRVV